jgi:hypothetical protein
MAPRYEPANIIVWIAASYVNFVFSSVDDKYINTRKKDPITSTTIYWIMSSGTTDNAMWTFLPLCAVVAINPPSIAPPNYAAI